MVRKSKRDRFLLSVREEYIECFGQMSNEDAGALVKALSHYITHGEVQPLEGAVKIAFLFMHAAIIEDLKG